MSLAIDPSLSAAQMSVDKSNENRLLSGEGRELKDRSQIKKLSRDFESIFVGFMLKSMRKSVPESKLMGGGNAENIYKSMLDAEYSQMMAKQQHTGLAKNIEDFLLRAANLDPIDPAVASANKVSQAANGNKAYGVAGAEVKEPSSSGHSSKIDRVISRMDSLIKD